MEPQNNYHKEPITAFTKIALVILVFALAILIFSMGVFVGQQRARFSYQWAENYHTNFGGPMTGVLENFPSKSLMNSHGMFGLVMGKYENTLIIKGQDEMEATIIVSDATTMRNATSVITIKDIIIGDGVMVIGEPNTKGQLEAKFIRILPNE